MKSGVIYQVLELSTEAMGRPSKFYPTLLLSGSDAILVDTGYPGMKNELLAAMLAVGVKPEQLNHIILTHHDLDHMGCLKAMTESTLPGTTTKAITVWAHEDEAPYIDGRSIPVKLTMFEPQLEHLPPEIREMVGRMKVAFANCFSPVDTLLADGEILPWGDVEVIHTPGHTPGHICLYLPESRTLIAGDLLTVKDDRLALLDDNMQFDLKQSHSSLKKLLNYDIQTIICYHGGLYNDSVNEQISHLVQK